MFMVCLSLAQDFEQTLFCPQLMNAKVLITFSQKLVYHKFNDLKSG